MVCPANRVCKPIASIWCMKVKQSWFILGKGRGWLQWTFSSRFVLLGKEKGECKPRVLQCPIFHGKNRIWVCSGSGQCSQALWTLSGPRLWWILAQAHLQQPFQVLASKGAGLPLFTVTASARGLLPCDCWFHFISLIYSFLICRLLKYL